MPHCPDCASGTVLRKMKALANGRYACEQCEHRISPENRTFFGVHVRSVRRMVFADNTKLVFGRAIHHWREALNHFTILWPDRMPALERVAS